MEPDVNKKVKFIIAWYRSERNKLTTQQRIALLDKWINSCVKFEEYEMSNALLKEKRSLIHKIRSIKNGERNTVDVIKLRLKILVRKIKSIYNAWIRPKV